MRPAWHFLDIASWQMFRSSGIVANARALFATAVALAAGAAYLGAPPLRAAVRPVAAARAADVVRLAGDAVDAWRWGWSFLMQKAGSC